MALQANWLAILLAQTLSIMPHSPELTGGEGFTFEGDVAAFYLSALLAESYAPGINDRIVARVSVQQRDLGEPLDDVIVDFVDLEGNYARLSLQVKRSLTISQARTNVDFRSIIRDSWATLKKSDFRKDIDRFGAAVGSIAHSKLRAVQTLCDRARESPTASHFDTRFGHDGSASQAIHKIKDDITDLLEDTKGAPVTNEELHQFLAHFVLVQFDFLREGATDPAVAINRIRDCLAPADAESAPLVWSHIVQLARASAAKSGCFDRARLVRSISTVARLRGATSLRADLDKIVEVTKGFVSLIRDDIGGLRLDRTALLKGLNEKLAKARLVQVRGLPGSGKSVVLRQAAERALLRGPVLFLKSEQIQGTSWASYAASHGLSGARLESLLVELEATGTSTLFIDAIDRVQKEHQPVILDLIRAISESPLLDRWSVVASLRDTGIEVLRNWLGVYLDELMVETLQVDELNDEEAEKLASANPHLKSLLFGSEPVRAIVRRPFFANVLNQGRKQMASNSAFAPHSEVDLVENWWKRGGYNATGQEAVERRRALMELAKAHADRLGRPIRLSQLTSVSHIEDLRSDGILQDVREGISVRFAHDIFFEWSFFHVLADGCPDWVQIVKACGEPPGVARAVELLAQWEYAHGAKWPKYLNDAETSTLRSQWLRAWLLGPLGTAGFEADPDQFALTVFSEEFRLFRKALVWFQAEKTTPNPNILASELASDQRQRYADIFSWPSDFSACQRLIDFILLRIADIPERLYPEIVAVFELWQNALGSLPNPTSRSLLQECASWLVSIDRAMAGNPTDGAAASWSKVPNLGAFRKTVSELVLRSAIAEPGHAADLLRRATNLKRLDEEVFEDIVSCSSILAQALPSLLVEFSLSFLKEDLPDERVARNRQKLQNAVEWRRDILAKPEAERTEHENMVLSSAPSVRSVDFSYHDWDTLSIHEDFRSFSPPSPLREPFKALFQSAPDEALRLHRELCNHAITAWRQLHRHSRDAKDTPLPLELTFPWGLQRFWGNEREYLWFRSAWAPNAIGCGFMALEEWCVSELGRGRPTDELIQHVIEGNECIAILGTASMLTLQTETVSDTTLPLVTSQRLLSADHNRMLQDLGSTANLIGFWPEDEAHIQAIKLANARQVRKTQLVSLVPRFVWASGPIGGQSRDAILDFPNNLPYQYEEDREKPSEKEHLQAQALAYCELADPDTYQAYRVSEDSTQVVVLHESPSAKDPDTIARAEEASTSLQESSLWNWASDSIDQGVLIDRFTIQNAVALARESETADLFRRSTVEYDETRLGMRRAAVSATAAAVLTFREECTESELEWARDALARAAGLHEEPDPTRPSGAILPWHHALYVARGFGSDLREGTGTPDMAEALLALLAHPLEAVSIAALKEATKLWETDPKLTWAALVGSFSLCLVLPFNPDGSRQPGNPEGRLSSAMDYYRSGSEWPPLPLPPSVWVQVPTEGTRPNAVDSSEHSEDQQSDSLRFRNESRLSWDSERAASVIELVPFGEILASGAKDELLRFLSDVLVWTNQTRSGSPGDPRRRRSATKILKWTRMLGWAIGQVAGELPFGGVKSRFLDPVLELEEEDCFTLLTPLTSSYISSFVFDAQAIPNSAIELLDLCLDRLLQSRVVNREVNRSGRLRGFDEPRLVRSLMFVEVERATLAARFANGDWSEISLILPLVDRFVRASGWAGAVMTHYLTLCERSKSHYPAEEFADQVLAIIGGDSSGLRGWHGTFIPARIAELVQHFAHRDAPLRPDLAQKLLRILDKLVDMGDRRSAALQLSEAFREVRLPSFE